MPDHVVDTNVLLVASAAHPFSPFDDSGLAPEYQNRVFEWLRTLRADPARQMVWDTQWTIYKEYRNRLTDQDYGLQVVREKMTQARFVDVEFDEAGAAVVPEVFHGFDPSDRKFLAVLLGDPHGSTLVNATDTDWLYVEQELADAGVSVEHVIEDWLRAKCAERDGR